MNMHIWDLCNKLEKSLLLFLLFSGAKPFCKLPITKEESKRFLERIEKDFLDNLTTWQPKGHRMQYECPNTDLSTVKRIQILNIVSNCEK